MSATLRVPHNLCAPLAASHDPDVVLPLMHQVQYRSLQTEEDVRAIVALIACYSQTHNVDAELTLVYNRCLELDGPRSSEHRCFVRLFVEHVEKAGVVYDDEHDASLY